MPSKGSYKGECWTSGCHNQERWIPTLVPSRYADYMDHRCCQECCILIGDAVDRLPCGYDEPFSPEYITWDNAVRKILELDKIALTKQAGR